MIEIPEAVVLAKQSEELFSGKKIVSVLAGQSPHKFAWFFGEKEIYGQMLKNKTLSSANARGGFLEIQAEDRTILFSEGMKLSYIPSENEIPAKHQLLIGFENGSYLASSVQMYGGMGCFPSGTLENPYYELACSKPMPGTPPFHLDYFTRIAGNEKMQTKSVKAVLATDQRIPGLGNGVLQDILYNACIHPKRKMGSLSDEEFKLLFDSIEDILQKMIEGGGRDTEKDLLGNPGGYKTLCSKHTVDTACSRCGDMITKKAYMGGSIYFCPECQMV